MLWKTKNKFLWLIRGCSVPCVPNFCDCFLCSWKLFPCLYFNNNWSILFFIWFSAKDSLLFIINSVSCFKVSSTSLGWSKWKQNILGPLIRIIFSSIIIMTWLNCCNLLVILLRWYKRYDICRTSFFNFYKLFPAFIRANDIGSLVNSLFRVNIFNPFPSFTSSSWPYSSGMSDKSIDSFLSVKSSFLNQRSWLYVSRKKSIGSYLLHIFLSNFNYWIHFESCIKNIILNLSSK